MSIVNNPIFLFHLVLDIGSTRPRFGELTVAEFRPFASPSCSPHRTFIGGFWCNACDGQSTCNDGQPAIFKSGKILT